LGADWMDSGGGTGVGDDMGWIMGGKGDCVRRGETGNLENCQKPDRCPHTPVRMNHGPKDPTGPISSLIHVRTLLGGIFSIHIYQDSSRSPARSPSMTSYFEHK
jgi:hypothetical protein